MRKNITPLTVAILAAVIATGCATTDMRVRDAQKITDSVALWKQGVEAADWDKVMTLCHITKGAVRPDFFQGAKVDVSNPRISFVNEDHMTVAPIVINGNSGKITVQLTMLKEKGRFYVLFVDPI